MTGLNWLGVFPLLLGSVVPGYLLALTWDKDWTDGLDVWERLFLVLITGAILNSWLLLILAELGLFSLTTIVASWAAICACLGYVGRGRLREHPLSPLPRTWSAILTLILLVLAGILFTPPAESFVVFDDSGIYIVGGIHLARTGGLFARDPVLASLSPDIAQELLFSGPVSVSWTRLWGQFFTWNWSRPWVSFGLLHMQRLWCALFTLFLGMYGGMWVAPASGLLATLGTYLLGRRLFSSGTGLLGAMLLTVNFVQIRYARYPVSEMLAQALVVGGFYLLALCIQKRHAQLGALAGLCLGGLFLVRIDALFIGLVGLGLALYWKLGGNWRRERALFGLTLGSALIYACAHNLIFGSAYLSMQWQTAGSPALAKILALGSFCLGSLIWIIALRPTLGSALSHWLSVHVWQIMSAAFAAVTILLILSNAFSKSGWNGRGAIWLAQYWTPLGLYLAGGGLAVLLFRRPTRLVLPLLITALGHFALFSLNPMVNPVHPWAMRRFVPVVMPTLALLTAYAITSLPSARFQLHRLVQVLAAAALIITFLYRDLPFIRYEEYEGTAKQIGEFAAQFEPGALILFDQGSASLSVSQPLTYLHDLNAFVLQKDHPDSSILTPFIEAWQQRGTPVYLVLSGGTLDWRPPEWSFLPLGAYRLRITRIQRSLSGPPTAVEDVRHLLDIYRLVPSSTVSPSASTLTHLLDMEAGEYPYLRGGFHASEATNDGLTYRWTNGGANLTIPSLGSTEHILRLRVAGGRPLEVGQAVLSIMLNGVVIAQDDLPADFTFEIVEVTLPSHLLHAEGEANTLELRSNTWTPAAHGRSTDLRELGVIVDWIEWSPAVEG